jgi:hypothetical protein
VHKIFFAVILSLVFSSANASSDTSANTASTSAKYDAGLIVGTLGGGVQLGYVISPNKFNVRLNYAQYDYSQTSTSNGASYTGTLKLQSTGLFGDWHPFTGTFRLTGGCFTTTTA